jgi:hypothetical protein
MAPLALRPLSFFLFSILGRAEIPGRQRQHSGHPEQHGQSQHQATPNENLL